ncbi:MAG TPA: ribosome biogenesis GTPase Der [Sedimentisphaerales bacterium]|jgi:GTP-binding protein|nr:ribosome biogenesis GTPase Der [Sedimentisphaerales bacterium]HNU29897.1 ribosome biogenesis GTPase Der [Sedimentisphaerales bacterium]
MGLPVAAIIGRPNVGKSSLLNALAGEMISIVDPTAGVTRDRVSTFIGRGDKFFELIDTGGYGIVDSDQLSDHIEGQILQAIASADLVLFVVDLREGVTPLDARIAELLRKHDLPVLGVANKADSGRMFPAAGEFIKFGFGEFLPVSAQNNLNKAVLLDAVFERLAPLIEEGAPPEPVMKIAIVGKRNAGKSSMVNAIAGSERVIVSEVPGTTRDAVDVRIEKDGKTLVVIDTAGVRKKGKMANDIEFYSSVRATRSVKRADVVWLLIDATEPVSQPDKTLAQLIADEHKTCILVVNKWDLAKDVAATGDYEEYLTKVLPGLKYAPISFTTATLGKNVQSTLDLSAELFKQATTHVGTGRLNKAFEIIKTERSGARRSSAKTPKIYYVTQVATNPVTFMMFVNDPGLFDEAHRRFIAGRLRDLLPIPEVPIRLLARPKSSSRDHPKD